MVGGLEPRNWRTTKITPEAELSTGGDEVPKHKKLRLEAGNGRVGGQDEKDKNFREMVEVFVLKGPR